MDPYSHAKLSVRDFGGTPEDYIEIHKFIDSTKFHLADFRHRAILHNTLGMEICEKIFGDVIMVDEKPIPVREIARRHIKQDCGYVPTILEVLAGLENKTYHKLNNPNKKDLEWLKTN